MHAKRMITSVLPLSLLFYVNTHLYANKIHLSGTVLDEFNQGISGAEVSLYLRNHIHTRTDNLGNFTLEAFSDESSAGISKKDSPPTVSLNGNVITIGSGSTLPVRISLFDIKGKKVSESADVSTRVELPARNLSSGIYMVRVEHQSGKTVFRTVISGNTLTYNNKGTVVGTGKKESAFSSVQSTEFDDILIFKADETQVLRWPVASPVLEDIIVQLMPRGVGYTTPGVPVMSSSGGSGDITTYGSIQEPEFSEGGACNYGSTGIRYYAAINVNQIPGDLKGDWNDGRICGRCAKVKMYTKEGEVRTTIVRITDKCPDDNCGIDLGGAPAGELMKDGAGRYSGEWEWVSCEGVDGVWDGPAALHIKEGSNEWWSLLQVRNGFGSVEQVRIKKVGFTEWMNLPWATEAENFWRLPESILQDRDEWDIEVLWEYGPQGTLRLPGYKLSLENTSYQLQMNNE